MNRKIIFAGCLVAVACLGACTKYPELKPQPQASYLRVFNSLNYPQGTGGLPPNEMTLLIDPVVDKNGLPSDAAVVGDYITVRDLFSSSYPANAGNIAITKQSEWPGSAPVLTAPTINGLDLSAWAQVPSGKHRIMLMGRPQADTPYTRLPASARANVIADTTVTFTPGEVYTMEAVVFDFSTSRTGAYLRQENFTKIPFSRLENYLSFYCLTAENLSPALGTGGFVPPLFLYYTLWSPICSNSAYNTGLNKYSCMWPAPVVNHVYFRSVDNSFGTAAPYDSLPMPPLSDFLYPDNSFVDSNYRPFPQFDVVDGRQGYSSLFLGVSPGLGGYIYGAPDIPNFTFPQGLAIAASNSQRVVVYPSVNIIEFINGTAYFMQLHRTFDPPIITN